MFQKFMVLSLAVIFAIAVIASAMPEPEPAASPYYRPGWGHGGGGWWGGGLGGWGGGAWGHHGGYWGHRPRPPIWYRG